MSAPAYRLVPGVPLLIASLMAGCSIHVPTIESDAIDYNQAIENMSNEVALLNVLRAKEGMPRHYSSISAIQGDLEFSAAAEVGALLQDGDQRQTTIVSLPAASEQVVRTVAPEVYSPKVSASVATSPNFTVSVLETDEFYKGILSPIASETIATYASQGWSGAFLAHMLFEAIEFYFNDGSIARFENNHRGDSYWKRWVRGMKLTTMVAEAEGKPVEDFAAALTPEQISALYEVGLELEPCKVSTGPRCHRRLVKPSKSARSFVPMVDFGSRRELPEISDEDVTVFLSGADVARGVYLGKVGERLRAARLTGEPKCKAPDTLTFDPVSTAMLPTHEVTEGPPCVERVRIVPRSTDGVIYFAGEYLRYLEGHDLAESCEPVTEICVASSNSEGELRPLFRIRLSPRWRSDAPLVSATLADRTYSIPADGSHRSMQVLALIQQLTNLHKKASAMPQPTFIQTR